MERPQTSQVRCAVYRRRRPERTPLYRVVQGHFETYLALAREGHFDAEAVPAYSERKCGQLPRGILADGFLPREKLRWSATAIPREAVIAASEP